MQHDGVHAASAQRVGRPAGYRLRIELAATHDAQIARQLRHEIVGAAGEKRQMPRPHEPVSDRHDVNSHELACRAAAVLAAVRRADARRIGIERPARVLVLRVRQRRRRHATLRRAVVDRKRSISPLHVMIGSRGDHRLVDETASTRSALTRSRHARSVAAHARACHRVAPPAESNRYVLPPHGRDNARADMSDRHARHCASSVWC